MGSHTESPGHPHPPNVPEAIFTARNVPRHARVPTASLHGNGGWVIDYTVVGTGTVVPQSLWMPQHGNDLRRHVVEAALQLPIFFVHPNGTLGIPVLDSTVNTPQTVTLRNGNLRAPLGGKVTTYIRIQWPGYEPFQRQIQIKDETPEHNQITIAKFAQHVSRSVDVFLLKGSLGGSLGGRIIGAIQASAGCWMPILQLTGYVM
ncbi:hypothetical protein BC834DRAFT_348809 [Gloeopeniophorella convolvens]|nr:hypothetical protein BC834DRAFT_348809 [Gloeopeniophorella convolvens]